VTSIACASALDRNFASTDARNYAPSDGIRINVRWTKMGAPQKLAFCGRINRLVRKRITAQSDQRKYENHKQTLYISLRHRGSDRVFVAVLGPGP
jgi:hypothetical protein